MVSGIKTGGWRRKKKGRLKMPGLWAAKVVDPEIKKSRP
jgi:hypothetical protein